MCRTTVLLVKRFYFLGKKKHKIPEKRELICPGHETSEARYSKLVIHAHTRDKYTWFNFQRRNNRLQIPILKLCVLFKYPASGTLQFPNSA